MIRRRWVEIALAHPRLTVLAALALSAAVGLGMLRLRLETDGRALVSSRSPVLRFHDAVSREFGVEDPVVLVVATKGPGRVFDPAVLRLLRDLTDAISSIDGIGRDRVQSLATERSDRFIPGRLSLQPFLDPLPETAEALDQLRSDLAAVEIYDGTLVSADGACASVIIEIPSAREREPTLDRIRAVAEATLAGSEAAAQGTSVALVGAPEAESLLGRHLMADLGLPGGRGESRRIGLLPIAIGLMAAVFLAAFRRPLAVLMPLGAVAACLSFVFGVMGWIGVPVYLTTAVTPVILTMIGVADQIHIFWRYRTLRRAQPSVPLIETIRETLDEMASPIAKTTLTTVVGFLSFVLSPLPPVRAFGAFTSLGVVFCFGWSMVVVPALLRLSGAEAFGEKPQRSPSGRDRLDVFAALSRLVRRRTGLLLGAGAMLALAIPFGVLRIRVQDSWVSGFSPNSSFRRASEAFDHQFGGSHVLLCIVQGTEIELTGSVPARALGHSRVELPLDAVPHPRSLIGCRLTLTPQHGSKDEARAASEAWSSWIVDADSVGRACVVVTARRNGSPKMAFDLLDDQRVRYQIGSRPLAWPETMARVAEFEEYLRSRRDESVGAVLGPATFVATTNFLTSQRRSGTRHVPSDPDSIHWLYDRYGAVRGQNRLRETVDANERRGIVTAFLQHANFSDTKRLLADIRRFERERLTPLGLHVEFAGDIAVSQALVKGITDTQLRSLAFSLLGVFLITTFVNRSVRWGALSLVPVALAVGASFAMMGFAGIALGVSTSMFAGMALGDGVDFAIHFASRYRTVRGLGATPELALDDTLRTTGPAITVGALAIATGFGVLMFSQVPVNARLGALVLATVLGAWVGTLLLLPALVLKLDRDTRTS